MKKRRANSQLFFHIRLTIGTLFRSISLIFLEKSSFRFSSLFSKLDDVKIIYGVTDTSLEEIFLGVAENPSFEDHDSSSSKCQLMTR